MLTNVVRDAEYLTCVRPGRGSTTSAIGSPCSTSTCRGRPARRGGATTTADELHDLVLGVGGRRGLVEGDLALLHALAAGQSVSAIAQALGCTDRTVRNRRQRLVTKLQELSAADA